MYLLFMYCTVCVSVCTYTSRPKYLYGHQKKHADCAKVYFGVIFYDIQFKCLSESLDFQRSETYIIGQGLKGLGLESRKGKNIKFPFSKSSRPVLDTPSLQLERYRGELREYMDQSVKLTTHYLLVSRLRMVELYLCFPIHSCTT